MANYLVVYKGGTLPGGEEARSIEARAWSMWTTAVGSALSDKGNSLRGGESVNSDGSTSSSNSGLTGYAIVSAGSLSEAAALLKGCPAYMNGSQIEIYEIFQQT